MCRNRLLVQRKKKCDNEILFFYLCLLCCLPAGVRGDRSDQTAPVGLQQLQFHSGQPLQRVVRRRGETQRGREVSRPLYAVFLPLSQQCVSPQANKKTNEDQIIVFNRVFLHCVIATVTQITVLTSSSSSSTTVRLSLYSSQSSLPSCLPCIIQHVLLFVCLFVICVCCWKWPLQNVKVV